MDSQRGEFIILEESEWRQMAAEHTAAAQIHTSPARHRKDRGVRHPVEDFLFEYYPYPFSLLENWHPGHGFALRFHDQETIPNHFKSSKYEIRDNLIILATSFPTDKEIVRLQWIAELLIATNTRAPNFACHGLHEWAMVYRAESIRHSSTAPLRLPQVEIDHLVESRPIACTHHDAFRFFATAAKPLNRIQPSLHTRHLNEQPACIHANMDLYKWAAKSMPWIGSELLLKTFLQASKLRDLDMRASPYDLSEWGLVPIRIETPEGRLEYESIQRQLAETARDLRNELIESLKGIIGSHALPSQFLSQGSVK